MPRRARSTTRSRCSASIGRGEAAGGRPEPDRHANMRLSQSFAAGRYQWRRGARRRHVKNGMVEIGALTRHVTLERSAEIAQPCAADRTRDAAYRASGDPQSRHHRRLARVCRSGGRAAGVPRGARRRDRHSSARRASAPSRPTISSRACSRPRSGRTTCLTAVRFPRPRRRHARRLSPSSRDGTATTRWSGSAAARKPTARASPTCGSSISASAQRRCARARPRPRSRAALSMTP